MRVQVLAETKMSEFVCLYYLQSVITLYSHAKTQCIPLTGDEFYMGFGI